MLANASVPDISGSYEQPVHDVKGDDPLFNLNPHTYDVKGDNPLFNLNPRTSYHYKKKSLQKRELNPNAESFVSSLPGVTNDVYILSSSQLSILYNVTSYSLDSGGNRPIPLHAFPVSDLGAMIALNATLRILSAIVVTDIFNMDTKQDLQDLSPRDFLKV